MPEIHARFSPSAADRRIHCPPSLLLEEQFEEGESVYAALDSPEHLLVVAAGGPAGGFGAVIPPWLGHKSKAVTVAIGACVDCEPPGKP